MRFLTATLLAVGLLVDARSTVEPRRHRETLDLFFKTADARQRLGEALLGLGVASDTVVANAAVLTSPGTRDLMVGSTFNTIATDGGIDKLIETIRKLIEAAAEPLKIKEVSLNTSSAMLNVAGFIRDASISKLSTFKVDPTSKVDLLSLKAVMNVTFDKLDAHGLYKVDATASDQLHIFGDGEFHIRLGKPVIQVDVQFGYDDEHFTIESLKIFAQLKELKVIMTNFLGGGEVGDLVCGIISDVGPAFLDAYSDVLSTLLSSELKETANALLAKMDIDTIIDWIFGHGGEGK